MPDIQVENHGSVCIIQPMTPAARQWVDENVCLEGWQWFGGGFAVDPRYLENLLVGMVEDGLEVA